MPRLAPINRARSAADAASDAWVETASTAACVGPPVVWTLAMRASMRSSRVTISGSVGSVVGNWMSLVPLTTSNVSSPEVTVMSTAVPWMLPVTWNV